MYCSGVSVFHQGSGNEHIGASVFSEKMRMIKHLLSMIFCVYQLPGSQMTPLVLVEHAILCFSLYVYYV